MKKRTTDSESGLFRKEEHKRKFAWEADTVCDKYSFVPEAVVTPGNLPDRVAFDEIYDKVTGNYPQVEAVLAGAAYKTPRICKKAVDNGHAFSTAISACMARRADMRGGSMSMLHSAFFVSLSCFFPI